MKRMIFAATAALAVAACGNSAVNDEAVQSSVQATIEGGKAVTDAVDQVIDEKGLGNLIKGAVGEAVQEAVPAAEIAAIGAIVDEQALADMVGEAIDQEALGEPVKDATKGAIPPQ